MNHDYTYQTLERAAHLMDIGKFNRALELISEVAGDLTFESTILNLQIQCYQELGKFDHAKQLIDIALSKYPNEAKFHALLSIYFANKDKYKNALAAIKTALRLEPNDSWYLTKAAGYHLSLHQLESAEAYIRMAEAQAPNDIDVIYAKVVLHHLNGDWDAACSEINRGLSLEPNNPQFNALYTRILQADPKLREEAEAAAMHTLSLDPTNQMARSNLLEVLKNRNRILRFFAGNAFNRYKIDWTPWRVILMIIFWKGCFIWGGFGLLYLIITWYCGVLFNTITRFHFKYKLLLTKRDITQSNVFILLNGLVLLFLIIGGIAGLDKSIIIPVTVALSSFMLISISYFEITSSAGKRNFFIYAVLGLWILWLVKSSLPVLGVLSILLLLIYAFFFTLNIAFK